jgi:hypothetical protein
MSMHTMRRVGVAACLAGALLAAACDGDARAFARKTADLLTQRSEQLTRKIKAERAAYDEIAKIAAQGKREVLATRLANERDERAIAAAADYAENRRPVSRWQSHLLDYALVDYDAHRETLNAELGDESRFMASIQALQIEQAKVVVLAKLLATLEKKPSLKDEVTAAAEFGKDLKAAIDQRCAVLKKSAATDPVAKATFENLHCPTK